MQPQAVTAKTELKGAKFYDLKKKSLLFTMVAGLASPSKDVNVFSSRYFDLEGGEILTEEAIFNKVALQKYVVHQRQLNEVHELEITSGNMNFKVTKNGITTEKNRALPDNLVVGPSFVPFLQQHWALIQSGKKLEAQLAVPERMDFYSFEFEKVLSPEAVANTVTVRFRPSSTLVASVVRPLYFTLSADGTKILNIRGRLLPKLKKGSRWQDFDGEAMFTY
jgi:hypothetical protein